MFSASSLKVVLSFLMFDRKCSFVESESAPTIPLPVSPYPEFATSREITLSAACADVRASVRLLSLWRVAIDRENNVDTSVNTTSIMVIASISSSSEKPFAFLFLLRFFILIGTDTAEYHLRSIGGNPTIGGASHISACGRSHGHGDLLYGFSCICLNTGGKRIVVDRHFYQVGDPIGRIDTRSRSLYSTR